MESKQIDFDGKVNQVYTLLVDKDKYKFWQIKKDGIESKAYSQFQQFGFKSGDAVDISVETKEKSFTNKEGKLINYRDNSILFFYTEDNNTPSTPQEATQAPSQGLNQEQVSNPTQAQSGDLEAKIKASFEKRDLVINELAQKYAELKSDVSGLKGALITDENRSAFELHSENPPQEDIPPKDDVKIKDIPY